MPRQSAPQMVADQLGRPADALQEIDRRPLPLAFLEGRYETYVVRDVETGERLEITLDLDSGRSVDPAELRSQDRSLATSKDRKLKPVLLDLLLRHPALERIEVRLNFALQPLAPSGVEGADWSDPDLRQAFEPGLRADLRDLGIFLDAPLPEDSPVLTATLSAPEIVKLGDSPWIRSIELAADPEVLDD